MSKRKARQRKMAAAAVETSRRKRKVVAALALVLILSVAGVIVAQWRATRVATRMNATLSPAPTAPSPGSPSKEYIYAGGRLIATEEPSSTPSPTPTPNSNVATFISQSIPTAMTIGQSYPISVTMRNTGTATWTPAAAYKLGSQNAQDNSTWGLSRVNVPSSVAPNADVTFSFNVTAPSTASTYNFQWKMLQEGVEWFGDASTNVAVNVTVNPSPTVSLTAPASNAIYSTGSNMPLSASAADSDGISKVQFYQGTSLLGEDTSSPYNFTWNSVPSGSYSLTAKATDSLGATTTSAPISVRVNAAPTSTITSPASGVVFTTPTNLTINANATDADGTIGKVEFFQGSTKLGEDLTAPYSLSWNNVSPGTYSLTAKATDNDGAQTNSAPVSTTVNGPTITENVIWTSAAGVSVSGNGLTKTASWGWDNAGAVSTKSLAFGDGYVEVTASENNTHRMFGLSNGNSNQDYTDIDYAMYIVSNSTIQIYERGVAIPVSSFGNYAAGDKLRVSVESGVVKYRKNGALFYTSSVTPAYPLLIDTSFYTPGATLNDAVISGQLQIFTENVVWANAAGVSVSGSGLSKTASWGWDNAGASSTKAIASGDGYVEVTASENNTHRMFGLSNGDSNQDYTDIDYAMYIVSNSTIQIYEKGVAIPIQSFGNYAAGDKLRVSVEGGVVKYRKNGALLYTSTLAPAYPLQVDTSFYTPGATVNDAVISGQLQTITENVLWTNAVGLSVSGSSLSKTATWSWGNAGAISTRSLASGDGYVEFIASEANTYRMCGLSNGDTNQDWPDIDYALYPYADGTLYIMERGVSQGGFGTYNAGDRLRVSVEGGVVKYRKNGVLLHSSSVAPTYPLLIDTSFYTPGATVTAAVISGNLQ